MCIYIGMYVFTSRLRGILKPLSEGCHQFQSWLDRLKPVIHSFKPKLGVPATMMHPIPRSSIDGMTWVLLNNKTYQSGSVATSSRLQPVLTYKAFHPHVKPHLTPHSSFMAHHQPYTHTSTHPCIHPYKLTYINLYRPM